MKEIKILIHIPALLWDNGCINDFAYRKNFQEGL